MIKRAILVRVEGSDACIEDLFTDLSRQDYRVEGCYEISSGYGRSTIPVLVELMKEIQLAPIDAFVVSEGSCMNIYEFDCASKQWSAEVYIQRKPVSGNMELNLICLGRQSPAVKIQKTLFSKAF